MSDEQISAAAWDLVSDDVEKQKAACRILRQYAGAAARIVLEVAHEWDENKKKLWLGINASGSPTDALVHSIKGVDAIDALTEALTDPDPLFRAFAVRVLSEIDDPRVIELLYQVFDDVDSNVRANSIFGLLRIGDQKSYEYILKALEDPDERVRRNAVWTLRQLGGEEGVGILIRMIQDPSDRVVCCVLSTLNVLGSEDAIEHVLQILNTRSERVQSSALIYLERIGDSRAIAPLINLILSSNDTFTIVHALKALGKLDVERTIELCVQMLKHPESGVSKSCAETLGHLKAVSAADALVEALEDTDSKVWKSAAFALTNIGDVRVYDTLVKILQLEPDIQQSRVGINPDRFVDTDVNQYIRLKAAKALGILGDIRAIEPLAESLKTDFTAIPAAISLSKLGDDRGIEYLLDRFESSDRLHKYEIVEALGQTKDSRAVPAIIEVVKAEDMSKATRSVLLLALRQIGTPEAVSVLESILAYGGESAFWAAKELAKIGNEPGIEFICSYIESCNEKSEYVSLYGLSSINHPYVKQLLISLLNHPSAKIRKSALCELGKTDDPIIIKAIEAKLNDPDRKVRTSAYIAMNKTKRAKRCTTSCSSTDDIYWNDLISLP